MSMDLLRSCSVAYSSQAMMMWQYSLSGIEQRNSFFENGEASVSNRMVQHPDGTIEIVPKTPGEVLGEKVKDVVSDNWGWIKKTFSLVYGVAEAVQQGVDTLKDRLVPVDRLFTRAVTFLPVADAQGTALVPYNQFRSDYSARELLRVDTSSYADYVASLSPKYCIDLLKDNELQDNYNVFIKEMNDLVLFMINASSIYDAFMQATVTKECRLLQDVEFFLEGESNKLSDNFALPSQVKAERVYRLQLPKNIYNSNGTVTSVQNFSFTNNEQSVAITLINSQSPSSCKENPVILVMKELFSPYISLLIARNMDKVEKFTYEQFTELFKDPKLVQNALEQIRKYKEYIKSDMQTVKSLSLSKINNRVYEQVEKIKRHTHLIRQRQKEEAEQDWPGWYFFTDTVTPGTHYCTEWKVKEYRRTYWNQALFSFELAT